MIHNMMIAAATTEEVSQEVFVWEALFFRLYW